MKELGVFKQMTQLAYLPIYHKLLCGAMELDVFSKLNTPVTAAELAGNESWNPANTEYMLGALRALGFLKHEDGRYVNTAETGKYLSADSPEYAGGFLMTYVQEGLAPMNVAKLVREGPNPADMAQMDPSVKGFAERVLASAPNLSDEQLIVGGLLGFFGIFLEGLAFFAIYRLMADAAPKYAHIYRSGIFGYIWLAPVGCHMNIGLVNYVFKRLLLLDPSTASKAAHVIVYAFGLPIWILLLLFWIPMIVVQFKAFSRELTPYPGKAKWFNLFVGAAPALILSVIIGPETALGAGIGTMFISFGHAFTFGGLLATLPSQECFDEFRRSLKV